MTSENTTDETSRPTDLTNLESNSKTVLISSANIETNQSPSFESTPTKSKNKRNRRRNAQQKKQLPTSGHGETKDEFNEPIKTPITPVQKPADQNDDKMPKKHDNLSESVVKDGVENEKIVKDHSNRTHESTRKHAELLKEKVKENKDLKELLKAKNVQVNTLNDHIRLQITKMKDLESSLMSATKTCNHLKDLLHQELSNRTRLESENDGLNHTISRLKAQVNVQEKQKSQDDEIIRVLNATLIERETEVSILKLKMTRLQTNSTALLNNDSSPSKDSRREFALPGRSNSEFCRNSYIRSSMAAEAASRSTSSNQNIDKDASIWAAVPEELTPSKRPLLLERSFLNDYDSHYGSQPTTPIMRDRRYRTLPKSMKSPTQDSDNKSVKKNTDTCGAPKQQVSECLVTNLDDSNNTSQSSGNRTSDNSKLASSFAESSVNHVQTTETPTASDKTNTSNQSFPKTPEHKLPDGATAIPSTSRPDDAIATTTSQKFYSKPDSIAETSEIQPKVPLTPSKLSGVKKLFDKFRRSDSTTSTNSQSRSDLKELEDEFEQPADNSFRRTANRSTLASSGMRTINSSKQSPSFVTERPFAEWNTDMLADWLTMIGLSMYANQCRRWVRCGAHIMNATPVEVDKGLGITNHLHRKKLRLAISELNGDCDRITKAAAKLDYLWVARWLDDIGLPQYKEAFINARVDGRVLNYLTVEDLVSLGVKSLIHHSSIKCGIKVLRSINFDLNLLKRRATAAEREHIDSLNKQFSETNDEPSSIVNKYAANGPNFGEDADVPLWTCHRVMEWLRMIDFAEFAPNLRGSGVHGGLIYFEDGFNTDTMCSLLSIPLTRTLLRRHLSTFFDKLIGKDLANRKREHKESSSSPHLNPLAEVKSPRKSKLWFTKLKGSKVGQDGMDEYLCPMYPIDSHMIKTPTRKSEGSKRDCASLPKIPESINV